MLTASFKLPRRKFIVSWFALTLISVIVLTLLIYPVIKLGYKLELPLWISIPVTALPAITASIFFFIARIRLSDKRSFFTGTKFTRFPLCMFFDPEPATYYRFRPVEEWWNIIEDADLLVRRHDRYLDGLILRQTGYFTHVGIAKKENDGIYVYHAVGTGVQKIPLTEFAHCDDLMVLRITREKIIEFLKTNNDPAPEQKTVLEKTDAIPFVMGSARNQKANAQRADDIIKEKQKGSVSINETIDTTLQQEPLVKNREIIYKMICESAKELQMDDALRDKELDIFDMLNKREAKILNKPWQSLVTELAEFYCNKGIGYDLSFDFNNPDKMSCVEFAWNCYKSFYPLHRIRRQPYTFFGLLKPLILAPDQFIESNAFTYGFNSVKKPEEREAFINSCKKSALNFWEFIFLCSMLQLVLLSIACCIFSLFK